MRSRGCLIEPTFSSKFAADLIAYASERGADRSSLTALTRLPRQAMSREDIRIPCSTMALVWAEAIEQTGDPSLAMSLGASRLFAADRTTALIMETSSTVLESFRLAATVRNRGTVRADGTTVHFYLSTDDGVSEADMQVGSSYVSRLDPAEGSEESPYLTAPSTGGTYYYIACVEPVSDDAGNDASNNTASGPSMGAPLSVESNEKRRSPKTSSRTLRATSMVSRSPGMPTVKV